MEVQEFDVMDSIEQRHSRLDKKRKKREIVISKQVVLAKCILAIITCISVVVIGLWFGVQHMSGSVPAFGLVQSKEIFGEVGVSKVDGAEPRFCRLLPNEDGGNEPYGNRRYASGFDKLIMPLMQKGETLPACRIVVNLPSRTLDFYNNNRLMKTYPLAIGKPSTPTPLGNFTITQKEINPWWYPPNGKKIVPSGPNNPLGYRWMGFAPMYGIHGTNTPWEIGGWVSNGCVRMQEADVEELFELVPYGTAVYINYDLVRIDVNSEGQVSLGIYPDVYRLKKQVTVTEVQRKLAESEVPNFVTRTFLQSIVDKKAGQQVALLQVHKLKVNGKLLSGRVVVSEGHIFVPVWEVATAFRTNVVWDEQRQQVYIDHHAIAGTVRDQILYVVAEDIQTVFGGMWLWQQSDHSWELVTLTIGRK